MKYVSAFGVGIAALISGIATADGGGGSSTTPSSSVRCTYTVAACAGQPAVTIVWYCTPMDGESTPTCTPTIIPNPISPGCGDVILPGCSGGTLII